MLRVYVVCCDSVVSMTFPKAGRMPVHPWACRTEWPTCFIDSDEEGKGASDSGGEMFFGSLAED